MLRILFHWSFWRHLSHFNQKLLLNFVLFLLKAFLLKNSSITLPRTKSYSWKKHCNQRVKCFLRFVIFFISKSYCYFLFLNYYLRGNEFCEEKNRSFLLRFIIQEELLISNFKEKLFILIIYLFDIPANYDGENTLRIVLIKSVGFK